MSESLIDQPVATSSDRIAALYDGILPGLIKRYQDYVAYVVTVPTRRFV